MKKKSDSSSKRISATKAGRSFSRILDEIEKGKSFLVHRHGKEVCHMTPVAPGRRTTEECIAILRARPQVLLDDQFGRDLLAIISGEPAERRPWD
jgi:antitoxin (DNA-binding transcriptional repressor) of toxin-antitoxin stability system